MDADKNLLKLEETEAGESKDLYDYEMNSDASMIRPRRISRDNDTHISPGSEGNQKLRIGQ